jgi:hypothetical protein
MSNPTAHVQKLLNYCDTLRDDGLSYGDYVEGLTFSLFPKMADEEAKLRFNMPAVVAKDHNWPSSGAVLMSKSTMGVPSICPTGYAMVSPER